MNGFAAQIRFSSFTGSYGMATADHREPCESRGSRTVLGAPGGEIPPGDSTIAAFAALQNLGRCWSNNGHSTRAAKLGIFPTYTLFNKRKLVRLSDVIAAIERSRHGYLI